MYSGEQSFSDLALTTPEVVNNLVISQSVIKPVKTQA